jgi:hypothetical protein
MSVDPISIPSNSYDFSSSDGSKSNFLWFEVNEFLLVVLYILYCERNRLRFSLKNGDQFD